MDDISIFPDKLAKPEQKDLIATLGTSYELWTQIEKIVMGKYPAGLSEWNYPGKKYGWSYRIKDKKRAIIYFLPRNKYFKVAFVFGQKATDEIMESTISADIKSELEQATKYAEGRGIRIDVNSSSILPDVRQLIDIKLKY
ncbi:MAG TPA: hypothetical protein DCG75_14805 [Bacteroidales bacterium]|nr:hypothetical protein [Bacteroidales bacterium]